MDALGDVAMIDDTLKRLDQIEQSDFLEFGVRFMYRDDGKFLLETCRRLLKQREICKNALELAVKKFDAYSKDGFWNQVEAKYPARKPMERCKDRMIKALTELERE